MVVFSFLFRFKDLLILFPVVSGNFSKSYFFFRKIMKESEFQSKLIKELRSRFPGCIVLKNDPTYMQGVPDLIILYNNKWAALECKQTAKSSHRPNQDYYVKMMNHMSYSNFIYPENKEAILYELGRLFETD